MMMKSNVNAILEKLDLMIPNPKCELEYSKPYELLMATVLSAQCTDSRVNKVTKVLWDHFTLATLASAPIKEVERIIYPVGTYHNKAHYLIDIANRLIKDHNGEVPNDFNYLVTLPGVGRKTANVVLSNIYDRPAIAVDTHVYRTSHRLGLVPKNKNVYETEQYLMKVIPQDKWSRLHHQLVLLGRYTCKAKNSLCENCLLKEYCHYEK